MRALRAGFAALVLLFALLVAAPPAAAHHMPLCGPDPSSPVCLVDCAIDTVTGGGATCDGAGDLKKFICSIFGCD